MAEIKDKVVTVESLLTLHEHNENSYMSKNNPVGIGSLSINRKDNTTIGNNSIAMGLRPTASGANSVAIGYYTTASGVNSIAMGYYTTASGYHSSAEGNYTIASGDTSHAEGNNTIATGSNQHVQGKYNIEDTDDKYAHIIGNGNSTSRSNAHTVDWDGNAWYAGDISVDGDIILTDSQYGDTLPNAGVKGRIFFKRLVE